MVRVQTPSLFVSVLSLFLLTVMPFGLAGEEPSKEGKPATVVARLEYAQAIYRAHAEFRNGNLIRSQSLLESCKPELRGWEWHYVNRQCHPELLRLPNRKAEGGNVKYTSAAFSTDGKILVTAHGDNTVSMFNAEDGKLVTTLTDDQKITQASFNQDGTRLVTTSQGQAAGVWDVKTGKKVLTLTKPQRSIGHGSFSPDGKRIITSGNRELVLWDAETGKEVTTFASAAFFYCQPSFSVDSKYIVSDGFGVSAIWKAETGTQVQRLKGGGNGLVHVARFSPDGRRVVVPSGEGVVRVYEVEGGKQTQELTGHAGGVRTAAYSADGKRIVTGGTDRTLRIWDTATGRELRSWKTSEIVTDATFHPDGTRILTLESGGVRIWDSIASSSREVTVANVNWIIDVAFSPDGKRIAAGGSSNLGWPVDVHELQTGKHVYTLGNHDYVVHNVEYSRDGKLILTRTGTGRTKIWDAATGGELHDLQGTGQQSLNLLARFTGDGSRVAVLRDGRAHLWAAKSGEKLREFQAKAPIRAIWDGADGKSITALTNTGELITWNKDTGAEIETVTIQELPAEIGDIWTSPNGSRLIIGGKSEAPRCYSTKTGVLLYRLVGMFLRDDRHLVFNPDGTRLATIQFNDSTIHLWDSETGHELMAIPTPSGLSCVAFSADGTRLVSTSDAGPLRIHDGRPLEPDQPSSPSVGNSLRWNDERVVHCLFLKTKDLWKSQAGDQLHVEDLFRRSLEFQESDVCSRAQVYHGDATFQFRSAFGQWYSVHRGRLADFGQADERVGSD